MNKEYKIVIDGREVTVSEEVYRAYKRPAWRERKRREVRREKERSWDKLAEDGLDVPDEQALVAELVEDQMLLEVLLAALADLSEDDRLLVDALFYQSKTEREVANEIGVSQNTVHYRKKRMLERLRSLIEKS